MRVTLILFVLVFGLSSGSAQQTFTLDEAVAYAMDFNRQVMIQKHEVDYAEGRLLEYKSIGIPKVEGKVNYTYYFDIPTFLFPDFVTPAVYNVLFEEGVIEPKDIPTSPAVPGQFGTSHNVDAGIFLNTMLFDFSWIQGLEAQQLYRELVVKQVDITEYEVRASITRAYFAVLISEKSYELLNNNIDNIERLLNETQALYENGFAEKLDADRLQLSLDNLRTEQQKVERNILITENLLKFQMGFPVDQEIELVDEFDLIADQMYVESVDLTAPIDFYARPEYSALTLTEELNEVNTKVIKAGYLPSLSGSAGYSQILQRNELFNDNDNPWFPTSNVGVSLYVPIFDGLERRARLDQAKIDLEQATLQREDFENQMTIEVRNARIEYVNSRETVESRANAMDLAESIYETTQIKYREGVGSSVELTQAESELYNSQTNYIDALYELILAKTDLDIALGKM